MYNRKELIDFAMMRMSGFTLEGSSDGDNRSIFGLIKTLLKSVPGDTLEDCRKPLAAVLSIKVRDPREKFHGCKVTLLHQTIGALFGGSNDLLSEREFDGYDRERLRLYLEACLRIFIAKYAPTTSVINDRNKPAKPEYETEIQRAWRLAQENSERKGKKK